MLVFVILFDSLDCGDDGSVVLAVVVESIIVFWLFIVVVVVVDVIASLSLIIFNLRLFDGELTIEDDDDGDCGCCIIDSFLAVVVVVVLIWFVSVPFINWDLDESFVVIIADAIDDDDDSFKLFIWFLSIFVVDFKLILLFDELLLFVEDCCWWWFSFVNSYSY